MPISRCPHGKHPVVHCGTCEEEKLKQKEKVLDNRFTKEYINNVQQVQSKE